MDTIYWILLGMLIGVVVFWLLRRYRGVEATGSPLAAPMTVTTDHSEADLTESYVPPRPQPTTWTPDTIHARMRAMAEEIEFILHDQARTIADAVYDCWLQHGGDDNVCLFAEMLEARLAPIITCHRSCVEEHQAVSALIARLVNFIIEMNPAFYGDRLQQIVQRSTGVLNAPNNSNWVTALQPGVTT